MTKVTALFVAMFISSTVLASPNKSEFVYRSLNVKEESVVNSVNMLPGASTKKSVGGLVCISGLQMAGRPVKAFDCTLAFDNRDDEAIYKALRVQEDDITPKGFYGSATFLKRVGNFLCYRRAGVYPSAPSLYECVL